MLRFYGRILLILSQKPMLTESFPFTECCRPVVTVRSRISDLMKIGNCFSKNILEGGGVSEGTDPARFVTFA